MKIKTIIFLANGNVAVFDDGDRQVPELQRSWLLTMLESFKERGGEFEFNKVDIRLPNGQSARVFRIEDGWNWEIL